LFGGVSKKRTCYGGATTGQQLMAALDEQVRRSEVAGDIVKFENWEFGSLVLNDEGVCVGITAIDKVTLKVRGFAADAVVICSGGYGEVFGAATSSKHCTGSAAMQVYKQGATFANPEFIQIHPTTIPGYDKMRLVTEGVRGDGGRIWVLRDGKPWYFLEEWYPEYGNLVPRDIASRAIWKVVNEMNLGVGGSKSVYLDITHLSKDLLKDNLAAVVDTYLKFVGEDPREVPMQVYPAVHYTMGGLWVDDNHQTTIQGVFAAGECDFQYHGANRLGGNSLLSAVYSGMIAGVSAANYVTGKEVASDMSVINFVETECGMQEAFNKKIMLMNGNENPHKLKNELSECLNNSAFILRYDNQLKDADQKILQLKERFQNAAMLDKIGFANQELFFMRTLFHQFDLAQLIVRAALNREESRGAHFKPEKPNRDDKKWLNVTKVSYNENEPEFDYKEKVEIEKIKPVERKY